MMDGFEETSGPPPLTRERIRQAAMALFVQKGYRRTTIAEIERAAGLVPRAGGFYRHFPSKEDLAAEIGETSIIETRADLGFDGILPLGETRAELVLIAKGYRKTFDRQAPLAALIAELRHLEKIRALEARVNEDLLEVLTGWLAEKPRARGLNCTELAALTLTIFGGWIFYLSKAPGGSAPGLWELNDEVMLDRWSGLWAEVLDQSTRAADPTTS
jgi:AcrR family transcriptional regulator